MNFKGKTKKYLITLLKVIGWISVSLVMLIILIAAAIQIPYVQNKLVQKAITFLHNKIGTEVRLEHISLSIPKKIVLTGLYLEDQKKDTLLYAGELSINTDLWQLTNQSIQLNDIELSDFKGSIYRTRADSSFNFDYIIKAFSGDTTVVADKTQAPWKFSIGNLNLENIALSYHDALEQNDVELTLGSLVISMDEFDLEKSIFKADEITLENVQMSVEQQQVSPDTLVVQDSDAQDSDFSFGVNTVSLKNIQGSYNHSGTGQNLKLDLGELLLEAKRIDVKKRHINLDHFSLQNTFISYHQMAGYQRNAAPEKKDTVASEDLPWIFHLDKLNLEDNSIQYHNFDHPFQKGAVDFNHLWITNLNTEAEGLKWEGSSMGGTVAELSFKERSGFSVQSFSTEVALSDRDLKLEDFKFKSPYTNIAIEGNASFQSLQNLNKTYPEATVRLRVNESVVGLQDILFFAPSVLDSLPLTIPTNATIALDAAVEGPMKNLSIRNFLMQTLNNTVLQINGNIQLYLDKDPSIALTLQNFYTTSQDIRTIVPDTMLPSSIALPAWLKLTGKMKGTFRSPTVNAILTSDLGKINLDATLNQSETSRNSSYTAAVNVLDFHVGKLLKQEATMGAINLTANASGTGLSMEDINAQVKLKIQSFLYQNYTYRNFTLDGSLKNYFFEGVAKLEDKNLDLRLDGDLDYNEAIPKYKFTFELKNADFKALHLSERPLKARGNLDVDLATSDFKIINGSLDIRKVAIFNGQDMYAVDSLLFASIDLEGQSEISIRSDIIDGNFAGTINLQSLPEVIRRHFDTYFSLQDAAYKKPATPQNFKFDLTIKNTDLITEIVIPELDPFIPGEIKGTYDSREAMMNLSLELSNIRYNGIGTDSITFTATSDKNALVYDLSFRKIQMDTLRIESLSVEGTVANDSIRTRLVILDSLQKDKYVLGGVFHSLEKVFQFRFLQDEVIMNYAPWQTPADNVLKFTPRGISAHNFSITNINEMIALNTSDDKDSTVSVVFKDLNLQNITKLVEGTTPIDGLANGDFNMMVSDQGAFNSELRIDKLTILDQRWGNLRLALGRTRQGPLNFDVRLEGDNTDLKAAGYYTADPSSPQINLEANIEKFDLASIDPLTRGALKNTKGQLQGNVSISGSTKRPDIDGVIRFKNAAFTPTMINSEFTMEDESITINNDEIIFENFDLKDPQNNLARLNGKITSRQFQDFNFNLGLTATDFQVLNSTEEDNELFYGNVSITTKANITGPINEPSINMQIDLSDESNFTYVVPQSEKGVLEQKGIVKFIDRDAKDDPFLASINPQDTIKSNFRGMNLSANIELNDQETFNIIIDPATGDKLTVKGNSTLTLDIDPTGDMVLSGRYEISEGSYDLSFYKLVKRNFSIEKGSTITWAGSPLDATMNIRAIYEVETSPIELIANQTEDAQALNQYRQRLPFMVYLQIKGEILTPEISFQLDLAEASRNAFNGIVYARIRDINTRESELNKQVFALLLLKRFISDNPLDNRTGSDVASTARRSVSKLLTEQLNRLSENVKGVELSFDVKSYEDYSAGNAEGQTQVQLGLSKSLLDDRLIVKVSGNFEVEGETSNQNSVSDYIGDLALEYKLTEDGRFRITGFRNSNFDMINGELIETGVGLIYIKDYNTLRELFKANAKDK